MYWFTGNGAGAANFLFENMYPAEQSGWQGSNDSQIWSGADDHVSDSNQESTHIVPTGIAVFAADNTIRRLTDRYGTISHYTEFDSGGHFPAMEVPNLYVSDVRTFFRGLR